MSAPSHDDDQLKLEIFDSFSKTVMRNASRNFAAAAKTRRKNESVNTDIVQYILKTHGENAVYPSEHFIDAGNGYCCRCNRMAVSGNAAVAAQTKGSGYFRILVWNVYFRDFRNIADLQTLRVRTEEKRICKYSQLLRKDTKA
mgnify:CR=1 FL=1